MEYVCFVGVREVFGVVMGLAGGYPVLRALPCVGIGWDGIRFPGRDFLMRLKSVFRCCGATDETIDGAKWRPRRG